MRGRLALVAAVGVSLASAPSALADGEGRPSFPNQVADAQFVVHYPDSVPQATALRTLELMGPVPAAVPQFGLSPVTDDRAAAIEAAGYFPEGASYGGDPVGDPRFDVYIDPSIEFAGQVGSGPYFHVSPGWATDAHTLAHEYFHAVQIMRDNFLGGPGWLPEGTANWFAQHVYPVDAGQAVTVFSSPRDGLFAPFGVRVWASFAEFVTSRWGEDTIAAIYTRLRGLRPLPRQDFDATVVREATEAELAARGTSLRSAFARYARTSAFPRYGYFGELPLQSSDRAVSGRVEAQTLRSGPPVRVEVESFAMAALEPAVAPRKGIVIEVRRPDGGIVDLESLAVASERVKNHRGGRGEELEFCVPRVDRGKRRVHLMLANPGDAAVAFRVQARPGSC